MSQTQDDLQSAPLEAAPHLADHLGVVLGRLKSVVFVGTLVFLGMMAWSFHKAPQFTARAKIRLETAAGASNSLLSELLGTMAIPEVKNELEFMGTAPVAHAATEDNHTLDETMISAGEDIKSLPPTVTIMQRHAHRPLETTLRAFGATPQACVLELRLTDSAADLPKKRREELYVFRVEGPSSPTLAVRRAGADRAHEIHVPFEFGTPFKVHNRSYELNLVQGSPWGVEFDVAVRGRWAAAEWIRESLEVGRSGRSASVLFFEFSAPTPELAASVTNRLANGYISLRRNKRHEFVKQRVASNAERIREILNGNKENSVGRESLENRRKQRETQLRLINIEDPYRVNERMRRDRKSLQARFEEAERAQKVADKLVKEINRVREEGLDQQIGFYRGPNALDLHSTNLVNRYLKLKLKIDDYERRGMEARGEYKVAKKDLADIETELKGRISADLGNRLRVAADAHGTISARVTALESDIGELDAKLESADSNIEEFNKSKARLAELDRSIKSDEAVIAQLRNQMADWEAVKKPKAVGAEVIAYAMKPQERSHPKLTADLLIALLLGLLSGIGWAYLSEYMDRRISSADELAGNLELPLLAAIPQFKTVPRKERRGLRGALAPVDVPWSSLSEAYRILRAKVRFANRDGGRRTIAIVSAVKGEGKSHTTLNWAATLASAGRKVLVVDADMRSPAVSKLLRPYLRESLTADQEKYGLSYVLENGMMWKGAVIETTVEGLSFMPAGANALDPGALLESEAFRQMQEDLLEHFDYVFYDVPPALAVADAASFLSGLDAVVLLARYRKCRIELVRAARDQVQNLGGKILGVIYNGFDARRTWEQSGYAFTARYAYARRKAMTNEKKRFKIGS